MPLVAHQEGDFSLFHLFGVVSDTFQPVLACYGLFCIVPSFHKQPCHRMLWLANLLWINFIYILLPKDCKHHYKVGQLKVGQMLQIGTGIYKEGKFVGFGNLLLYSLNNLPLGILEKLKFCYNQKKKEITTPSTDISAWLVSLGNK